MHTLILPSITKAQSSFAGASEADLLNVALLGRTAKPWRDAHPDALGKQRGNATLEQPVRNKLESPNAVFIRQWLPAPARLHKLHVIAITQMRSLLAHHHLKRLAS